MKIIKSIAFALLTASYPYNSINAGGPLSIELTPPPPPPPKIVYIDTFKHGHYISFKDQERQNISPISSICSHNSSAEQGLMYGAGFFLKYNLPRRHLRGIKEYIQNIEYPTCKNKPTTRDKYIDPENYNLYIKFPNLPGDLWLKFEMNITQHRRLENSYGWTADMGLFGTEYNGISMAAFPSYGSARIYFYKKSCQEMSEQEYKLMAHTFFDPLVIYENPKTRETYIPNKVLQTRHINWPDHSATYPARGVWDRFETDLLTSCYPAHPPLKI